jgi:hypothetical protein
MIIRIKNVKESRASCTYSTVWGILSYSRLSKAEKA